ncbi:hypothetical protein F0562_019285 [Nyssa sinensis]|uniref:Late embryogenesis abundant protein LEA-2 subgroup domain-containing protein n=1 Tax=Nyssa sinensis TaxID=561372 RepID=A0A5J4ZEE8_9ASTE|nr:hypothetical protein F0562_019285 [Nyssa sinensis]
MDEKQASPFAPFSVHPRSDEEFANSQSEEELRRKKKLKLYAYIAAFAVFQTIVILIFALTVMRIKTPAVRIRSVTVQNLNVQPSSYSMTLIAEVTVRNKNFGHYKYDNSSVSISHGDAIVGNGEFLKGNAKAKKTRRVNVTMEVSSNGISDASRLSNEISSGTLMFNSQATLRGKVELMKVMKKRKTAQMNCTMALNLTSGAIQNLSCRQPPTHPTPLSHPKLQAPAMAAKEQVRPLAPASERPSSDEDEITLHLKQLRRKKCIKCCGCIAALLLVEIIVVIILIFTVFRVKDPIIMMNGVNVDKIDLVNGTALRPGSNMSLTADVSVKNPNVASFKYSNTTTTLYYRGAVIGEARGPPGHAKARRTMRMNVTVDIITDRLVTNPNLQSDVSSGLLTMSSFTKVGGRVKILKIIKKHVIVKMNCTMTVNISSRAIQEQKCKRKVKL